MKRLIASVVVIFIILGVCGCKKESNTSTIIIIDDTDSDTSSVTSDNQSETYSEDNKSQETSNEDDIIDNTSSTPINISNQYINYDKVVEVDICDDIVRAYLDADDAQSQYYWLSNYTGQKLDYQTLSLNWNWSGGPYTAYFSENSDFSNAMTMPINSTEIKSTILIPGKTYYWKVVGADANVVLGGGKIKVADAPVRWISVDGIRNVRDMGGWTTVNGKKVKYEMLYRGAQLNAKKDDGTIVQSVKSSGLETFNKLGIKTEFDLRGANDAGVPAEGTNLKYVFIANHTAYHNIFSKSNKNTIVSNYKTMFNYLSDSSNYPIYTHCQGGADRTGTYAFLLNGLLGVSYEDLTRDFELTSFGGNKRWRGEGKGGTFGQNDTFYKTETGQTIAWGELYNEMMAYGSQNGCTTLQQSIEHWFINYIGIPKSQIDSFKSIMLE